MGLFHYFLVHVLLLFFSHNTGLLFVKNVFILYYFIGISDLDSPFEKSGEAVTQYSVYEIIIGRPIALLLAEKCPSNLLRSEILTQSLTV